MRYRIQFSILILAISFSAEFLFAKEMQKYDSIDKELHRIYKASIDEVMFTISKKEKMRNAFGGSDIFGRKVNKGFTQIKYIGFNQETKKLVFAIYDQNIQTNEHTMNTNPTTFFTYYKRRNSGSGFIRFNKGPEKQVLPPNSFFKEVNFPTEKYLNVGSSHFIIIQKVKEDKSKIKYKIKEGRKEELTGEDDGW